MMKAMTITAVCVVSLTAGAATAATFSGNTSGYFSDKQNADPDVVYYNYYNGGESHGNSSGIAWGYDNPHDHDFSDTSQLGVNNTHFSCDLTYGMQSCDVAKVDWYNASSNAWTNDEDFNVNLNLAFNLDSPVYLSNILDSLQLNILSTRNDLSPNSDLIVSGGWDQFHLEGFDLGSGYTLHGFSLREEGAGTLRNIAGRDFEWVNEEDSYSHLYIVADIKGPSRVPLPAAGWMLIAGFGGLVAMNRRRKG